MTTTRAAAGSMLFQASAHATGAPGPAAPGSEGLSLRSLTFCNLRNAQGDSLGVRCDKSILDVGKAGRALRIPVPTSVDEVLEGKALAGLQKVLASPAPSVSGALVPVDEARFSPCISRPQTILMLGNALSPHGGVVRLPPRAARKFDDEVELQVIIGKVARDVSEAHALAHVFGDATGNDFSGRDLQSRDGKGSAVHDRQDLRRGPAHRALARGRGRDARQWRAAPIRKGVINGMPEARQVWLKPGDRIACSVEKVGAPGGGPARRTPGGSAPGSRGV